MTIIHPISNFTYQIFSIDEGNKGQLLDAIKKYYSVGSYEPKVELKDDYISVELDVDRIEVENSKFKNLIRLCETGNLLDAKNLAQELIAQSPNISEYHRILGQIYSDLGDQEEATNSLIDALRWNPKNEYALLMMGNIFAKHKDDIDTALTYYDQVLEIKPDDNIALNNIGANLMHLDKKEEAIPYFEKALESNPDYPNTYYALGLINQQEESYAEAFNYALKALEKNSTRNELFTVSLQLAFELAQTLHNSIDSQVIVKQIIDKLQVKCGKPIKISDDDSIPTAAKIEFAENYDRDHHLVKYKPNYPGIAHLITHELIHLELVEEARDIESNMLFVTRDKHTKKFILRFEKEAKKLLKKGINEQAITKFIASLHEGLNLQIFNAPVDLFIEDRIYNRYKELRPIQFVSLYGMLQEGIKATTDKKAVKSIPPKVLSISKILNMINAWHIKTLFGVDFLSDFKANDREYALAEEMYKEFLEYREDKKPAEEYEIIQHWAEDLNYDKFFELISEQQMRPKQQTADTILDAISQDPYGLNVQDDEKEAKMKEFIKTHSSSDLNMAVVMYMVDALQYFSDMENSKIKEIAFEIAHLGMTGINPKKDGYHIPSIKGSSFSGYKTLAYYYTSWALAIPEMLGKLQLPFDEEYRMAHKLIDDNVV